MPRSDTPKSVKCSFCGKTQENVKRLVAALIVFLIPSMLDFIFTSLVTIESDFSSCWIN